MSKLAIPKHICLEEIMTEEEKILRDAELTQIYEGTNEINRLTIADEIIGRRLIA